MYWQWHRDTASSGRLMMRSLRTFPTTKKASFTALFQCHWPICTVGPQGNAHPPLISASPFFCFCTLLATLSMASSYPFSHFPLLLLLAFLPFLLGQTISPSSSPSPRGQNVMPCDPRWRTPSTGNSVFCFQGVRILSTFSAAKAACNNLPGPGLPGQGVPYLASVHSDEEFLFISSTNLNGIWRGADITAPGVWFGASFTTGSTTPSGSIPNWQWHRPGDSLAFVRASGMNKWWNSG